MCPNRLFNLRHWADSAASMKQTPMCQLYAHIAPRPEDWPVFHTKLGEMFRKDYDLSKDVPVIKAPTLLVDALRTAFELLGGGKKDGGWDGSGVSDARLAILPSLTHYMIFSSPLLASTVTPFLDAPYSGSHVRHVDEACFDSVAYRRIWDRMATQRVRICSDRNSK
jgi:hypothetical protein